VTDGAAELSRGRAVTRVLWITLVLNLVVALAKGIFGLATGAMAITTDAMHSMVDATANVIALFATRMADAPPDPLHPYGHRKFEIVAAAAIGVGVGAAAVRFAWDAGAALLHGRPALHPSGLGFGVILTTWAINAFVATYEARRGHKLKSAILLADASHTASDVVVTGAVLVSYSASAYGVAWADPVGALVVVAIIARVSWKVLSSNLSILVDRAVVDPEAVCAIAGAVSGVVDCHRIRSRGTGGAVHVDLHIQVDGELSVREAHDLAHLVEDRLCAAMPVIVDVTVHVEPEDDDPESL